MNLNNLAFIMPVTLKELSECKRILIPQYIQQSQDMSIIVSDQLQVCLLMRGLGIL